MKWLLAMMLASSVADIATTEVGLARGYSEYNPLMRNRAVRITVKLVMPGLIYYWTRNASPKRRVFWCVVASSVWASLATHNLYIMYVHPL